MFAVYGLSTYVVQADTYANVGLASNYVSRGLTQTADKAALSGGIDYFSRNGMYGGVWTSNVNEGSQTQFFSGYSFEIGELNGLKLKPLSGMGVDSGIILNTVPHGGPLGAEIYSGISYQKIDTQVSVVLDDLLEDLKAFNLGLYLNTNVNRVLKPSLDVDFHLGLFVGETVYLDYGLSVTKFLNRWEWRLSMTQSTNDVTEDGDIRFFISLLKKFKL